jgi:hypothetical protein
LEIHLDTDKVNRAEAELNRFINSRSEAKKRANREAAESAMYIDRYHTKRDAELRELWCSYHKEQAERLRRTLGSLIEVHENQAHEYERSK